MTQPTGSLRHRWLYVAQNLQVAENVTKVEALLRRAKAAGYNGIVLADYKLSILDRVPSFYFTHLAAVKQAAEGLGIQLYPTVCSCGYDNGLLAHDPNLAEGLPVRGLPFLVKGREAHPAPPETPWLTGGGFEELRGGTFAGWDWNDPAQRDTENAHSGRACLRFENPRGNARVSKLVRFGTFRQVHVSFWVKTKDFPTASEIHCTVLPEKGPRSLCHNNLGVKPNQDWTQHHAVFNTLDNDAVRLYIGAWGAQGGTLWIDDVQVEVVGFLNVVRRAGCPLTVLGEQGRRYDEGRDFAPVKDERMGNVPWPGEYEVYHAPPPLRLTANSRIRDGERLQVSYYHAVLIYENQVSASLVDPKVFAIHQDQLQRVTRVLQPAGFFLSHDELRTANWSADAAATQKTAGQLLAAHVARCSQLAHAARPAAAQFVWSDMFDPFHNAVDNYYLVKGTLAGAWEGLPKELTVVNWNSGKARESLAFFGKRGHSQILAGYYDSDPAAIKGWLTTARSLPGNAGVVGAMYTTWRGEYRDLEAFARAAWGASA